MSKTKKTNSDNITVVNSHRKANIAVIIVVGIAVAILVAIAVLSAVRVDPVRGLERPSYYNFYDLSASSAESAPSDVQSKISVATQDMKFSVMSAVLQWKWDYSYNFKRNASGEKVELDSDAVRALSATSSEFMIEYVYPSAVVGGEIDYAKAQSLKVDGETIYFDRVKVLIGDSEGKVGTISLYPYLHDAIGNEFDKDNPLASDVYKVTGINVRANTSKAFAAFKDLAAALDRA